jgi:hypothetical protein
MCNTATSATSIDAADLSDDDFWNLAFPFSRNSDFGDHWVVLVTLFGEPWNRGLYQTHTAFEILRGRIVCFCNIYTPCMMMTDRQLLARLAELSCHMDGIFLLFLNSMSLRHNLVSGVGVGAEAWDWIESYPTALLVWMGAVVSILP